MSHCGWSNFETWAVHAWLNPMQGTSEAELIEILNDMVGDSGVEGLLLDLLTHAIERVNTFEIARSVSARSVSASAEEGAQ